MFLFKLLRGVGLFPPDCILQQGRAAVLFLTEAPGYVSDVTDAMPAFLPVCNFPIPPHVLASQG